MKIHLENATSSGFTLWYESWPREFKCIKLNAGTRLLWSCAELEAAVINFRLEFDVVKTVVGNL